MSTSLTDQASAHQFIVERLTTQHYAHLSASQSAALVAAQADAWSDFAAEWEDLRVDRFMADGGTYRYRRYGAFAYDAAAAELRLLPHGPYIQDSTVNSLNGGIERHFEPLTDSFCASPVLQGLLRGLGDAYSDVEKHSRWTINLHPYRILASADAAGQPAPEGMHRDGVTYILTMMIGRNAITGGESGVHTNERVELQRCTLRDRGEILLGDDRRTLHSVTPITPSGQPTGHRDVLVVAFTASDTEE
jgi:hypothetical protein